MPKKRIFISSVYKELIPERTAVREFIERDEQLRHTFDLLLPEEARPDSRARPALAEVDECDLFLAIIGYRSGAVLEDGKSAVEMEVERALQRKKLCLVLVKGLNDSRRDPRMTNLVREVGINTLYRRFRNRSEFNVALRDALLPHLERLRRDTEVHEDGRKYHIFFLTSLARQPDTPLPAIFFSPVRESSNEFGLRTQFRFQARVSNLPPLEETVHLAFVEPERPDESPADKVEHALSESGHPFLPASALPEFYTLLPAIQTYRLLVKRLGPQGARDLLTAVNDLVILNRNRRPPAWLKDAMDSDQFNFSFMRTSEAFFALKNAAPLLGGLEQEELSGISKDLRLRFKLPTFQNHHEIVFGFEHSGTLPKRIAVIIGKNGTGKSQSLAHIVDFLLRDNVEGLCDLTGGRPSITRLLAVSSPGETYTTFPQPPRFATRINYRRIFLSRRQWGNAELGLGQALVELSRSEQSIRERTRWNLFCESVNAIVPLNEVFVPVRNADAASLQRSLREPFPLSELQEGTTERRLRRWSVVDPQADLCRVVEGKAIPLSSGQITFMRFAAQACLFIENGSLLLCDEPETHLHPNYIANFVRLLDSLLASTGSFAILATHSAYFVREVPRSQVVVLRESQSRNIEVAPVRLRTLGADVGAISAFVFEEEPYGFSINELGRRLAAEGISGLEVLKSLEQELPAEAVMHLRKTLQGQNIE